MECGSLAAAFPSAAKHNYTFLRLKKGISLRTLPVAIALAVSSAALQAAQNPAPVADSNTTILHVTVVEVVLAGTDAMNPYARL